MTFIILGVVGVFAGCLSAWWWLAAARVPLVYDPAMLDGDAREGARTDLSAKLSARAAAAASVTVLCQAGTLAVGLVHHHAGR